MELEDRLLQGAIDLHAHVYPEYSLRVRGRVNAVQWAELARAAGMRAIVFKSQFFPTPERAELVRRIVPGIEIYGSITLNHPVGGLNPLAVEAAAELGARIVWMPTWCARNELAKSGNYLKKLKDYIPDADHFVPGAEAGIELFEHGKLKPAVKEIVGIARNYRMVVASGHVSIQESLALAEECRAKGVPFFLTHPLGRTQGASIADLKEIAKLGGYIEHCYITAMPLQQRLELSHIVEAIQEVGPEQTIMTTDAVHAYHPPPPEVMRMFIGSLLHLKVSEEWIRKMVQDNPAKILGLDEVPQKI